MYLASKLGHILVTFQETHRKHPKSNSFQTKFIIQYMTCRYTTHIFYMGQNMLCGPPSTDYMLGSSPAIIIFTITIVSFFL